jgi:hypothetical protein
LSDPQGVISQLAAQLSLTNADPVALAKLVVDGKKGKWQKLADDDWFRNIEGRVDSEFRRYFARELQPASGAQIVSPSGEPQRAL